MYSILPAVVAAIFLGYGLYVVSDKGFSRITGSFFALCLTTFCWQMTWAALFQVQDPTIALYLIKFGYCLILFLPTSLYHLLTEISERASERPYVYCSYAVAAILGIVLLGTNEFIAGYYSFYFGFYPRAGTLHPLHVLQTSIVVSRGLYTVYKRQSVASENSRARLRLCFASVLIYFFAAVDYLCNYGLEFYPPGVIFIAISLGVMTIAIVRYDLLVDPVAIAGGIAHEIRTPLGTILMQAQAIAPYLPDLCKGYQLAVAHGLCEKPISPSTLQWLPEISDEITHEVKRANTLIEIMLASASMDRLDKSDFRPHSILSCVSDALGRYSFSAQQRARIVTDTREDFDFHGSDTLLVFLLYNLIKNALYAIDKAGKGTITLSTERRPEFNCLRFTDTATGIAADVLPKIFDMFYSTKSRAGNGIGLAFCRRVMESINGRITCDSVVGQYTTFTLQFPPIAPSARAQ